MEDRLRFGRYGWPERKEESVEGPYGVVNPEDKFDRFDGRPEPTRWELALRKSRGRHVDLGMEDRRIDGSWRSEGASTFLSRLIGRVRPFVNRDQDSDEEASSDQWTGGYNLRRDSQLSNWRTKSIWSRNVALKMFLEKIGVR